MKIVFVNMNLISGGIEKCIELLSSYLYKENEIEILYLSDEKYDKNIEEILSKYAKISKLENQKIECDLCIFCYLYFNYKNVMEKIQAKRYWCWIHSKPRQLPNCVLDSEEFINKVSQFICVSKDISKNLNVSKEGIIIHNFIDKNIKQLSEEPINIEETSDDKLKLVVVSRLSTGKGFDRVEKLVKTLEKRNIKYELNIIGKGRTEEQNIKNEFKPYKNVKFLGYQYNPYKFVKNADYLLQLSDYETWGNVITEAKALRVPSIVTNFPAAYEQVDDEKTGIIIPLELEDYNIVVDKAIKIKDELKQNLTDFKYRNEIDEWQKIINKI